MRIITADLSRKIDKMCIENIKIPGIVLMENAAIEFVNNVDLCKFNSFVIVCGKGNNGGDGLAIARHLYLLGKKINVFLIGNGSKLSHDCSVNYNIAKNMGIKINFINTIDDVDRLRDYVIDNECVIDCIFGTGLSRNIEGIYEQIICVINENSHYTISVDVPSGFNSDNGNIMGICVRANKTVSFVAYKRGFLKYGANSVTGEICVSNIGVPESVLNKVCDHEFIIERQMISKLIKPRDKYSHKGDFGRTLIIAGNEGYTGAAYICTQASVKSGAGLVTLACPKTIQNIMSCKLVEAMTIPLENEDELLKAITRSDSIAIGPGMGDTQKTYQILKKVIENANCPIVIDADGINVIKRDMSLLKKSKNKIILTPHPGELSRITGFSVDEINSNRLDVAKEFAAQNNVILLLKGYNTVITDGHTLAVNSTGTSSMANGGMGDCLTGIIASFISQRYNPLEAACIAAYLHGYCGDELSKKMFCVNASNILEKISSSIKELLQ